MGHVLLEEHHPLAIGNPCVIINTEIDEVVEQATRFLERVGYVGFSNFDLKYDRRDGTLKFFEINVRLGRSNFYVTAGGNNVSEWYVRDWVRHEEMQAASRSPAGSTCSPSCRSTSSSTMCSTRSLRDKALGAHAGRPGQRPELVRPRPHPQAPRLQHRVPRQPGPQVPRALRAPDDRGGRGGSEP